MGFPIQDQMILGAIAAEKSARTAALAGITTTLTGVGANLDAQSSYLSQVAGWMNGNGTFNASAIKGQISMTQIQPGFASASVLNALATTVASNLATLQSEITGIQTSITTATTAMAASTQQLQVTVTNNNTAAQASVVQSALVAATATSALAATVSTLTATVGAKINVFTATSAPTAVNVGDIWINPTTGVIEYWVGGAWTTTNVPTVASVAAAQATAISTASSNTTSAIATNNTSLAAIYETQTASATAVAGAISTASANASSAIATNNSTLVASLGLALASSVTSEASARATQTGNLSANYSLTVTAGNQITGMQLNSASGGGTTQSTIAFQAGVFTIWNGSSAVAPFTVTGGVVYMGNATVSGILNIGTGISQTIINSSQASFCGGEVVVSGSGSQGYITLGSLSGYGIQITGGTAAAALSSYQASVQTGYITSAGMFKFSGLSTFTATASAPTNSSTSYTALTSYYGTNPTPFLGTPRGWIPFTDSTGTACLIPYYHS